MAVQSSGSPSPAGRGELPETLPIEGLRLALVVSSEVIRNQEEPRPDGRGSFSLSCPSAQEPWASQNLLAPDAGGNTGSVPWPGSTTPRYVLRTCP